MKHFWAKSMAGLLASTLLLSACSTSGGNQENEKAEGTSKNEVVTLKFNTWNSLDAGFDVMIKEFESSHPNIKIDFVSPGDNNSLEAMKRVDLAAASGEDMDVIMVPGTNQLVPRIALDMFEPLDDYMAKEGVAYEDEYKVDLKVNNKYYGLPGTMTTNLVIINEDHLKEAGLEVPKDWTWDEYLEYAKAMTKTENGKTRYGNYFHTWANYASLALNGQMENTGLVMDDHKTANILNPALKKSLELRLQSEKDKSSTPYAEVISQKLNYRPQYLNQDASMLITGSYILVDVGGTETVPANFKTVFAPYPKMNKEDPMVGPISADILTIYGRSKHKEEAYTFVRWFTTEWLTMQGQYLPSWKGADLEKVVDKIISNTQTPEHVDKESLLYVLNNSITPKINVPVSYQPEVEKIFIEEFDRMMLANQDLDTTMKNMNEKIQKLIDDRQ